MKLHICCGWTYLTGYTNIDIQGILKKDYKYKINETTIDRYYPDEVKSVPITRRGCFPVDDICDICIRWPYESNSVDEIIFFQGIEHFIPEEGEFIISEIYRVLKPGGTFLFDFPDIVGIVNEYNDFDMVSRLIYCNHKDPYSIHKSAYNKDTFTNLLVKNREWQNIEFVKLIEQKLPIISGIARK